MNTLALSFLLVHSLGAVAILVGAAVAACFAGDRVVRDNEATGRA
jgi:hypothetical protein